MLAKIAELLREESGKEGIFTDTCAYDDTRKKKDREEEAWIPLKEKPCGTPWTKEEAIKELDKIPGRHGGLRLNHDGTTIRFRVQKNEKEKGWGVVHASGPPPNERWVLDKVQAEIPLEAVPRILKNTIGWEVQEPRGARRGRGHNAHWRIVVKAHGPPSSDVIEMDGICVGIRKEVVFANEVVEARSRDDFFGGLAEQVAAERIHLAPKATEGMKQFAYSFLEAKGGVTTRRSTRRRGRRRTSWRPARSCRSPR